MTINQDLGTSDISCVLRPIAKASFSLLDNGPVLFNETSQKLYKLNDTAAYVWCALLDQKRPADICDELALSGLERAAAANYVNQALRNWFRLGLLEPDWRSNEFFGFSADIGKLNIRVQTSSERLAELLIPLFAHTSSRTTADQEMFDILEMDGLFHIFHNKEYRLRCSRSEVVPAFKAYLSEQIVLRNSHDIAFHGACLLLGGAGLLLSGRPGAGKTTLAVHLMEAGFHYAADDIVLIDPDGRITGVPFAPSLKPGAWPIVERFRPELSSLDVHNRPDNKRVRYLSSRYRVHAGSLSIRWIFFIKRATNASPQFIQLNQVETMKRLIAGSYSPGGKLTQQAFHAIKRTLTGSKSFELRYSNAAEASEAVLDLCNSSAAA